MGTWYRYSNRAREEKLVHIRVSRPPLLVIPFQFYYVTLGMQVVNIYYRLKLVGIDIIVRNHRCWSDLFGDTWQLHDGDIVEVGSLKCGITYWIQILYYILQRNVFLVFLIWTVTVCLKNMSCGGDHYSELKRILFLH